jgi:hypothetical protein
MARSIFPSISDQNATVRQLKLLVVVLVLSNIGLGAFSFYQLREMDRRYSELFGRSIPILSDLQTLTAKAVAAMRGTRTDLFLESKVGTAAVAESARAGFAVDRSLRGKLLKAEWIAGGEMERAEFQAAGENFSRVSDEVIAAYAAGRTTAAAQLRDGRLRPAFERYLDAVTKLSDVVEEASVRANDAVSARTGNMSTVLLGLGSWPVVLLIGLLLLTAAFVVVLMVLFRGREISDTP